jgi:hypothetical protein
MPEADEYTLRALQENLSLMAVDSITNKLLGVAINGVVTRDTLSVPIQEDFQRKESLCEMHCLSSACIKKYCAGAAYNQLG